MQYYQLGSHLEKKLHNATNCAIDIFIIMKLNMKMKWIAQEWASNFPWAQLFSLAIYHYGPFDDSRKPPPVGKQISSIGKKECHNEGIARSNSWLVVRLTAPTCRCDSIEFRTSLLGALPFHLCLFTFLALSVVTWLTISLRLEQMTNWRDYWNTMGPR